MLVATAELVVSARPAARLVAISSLTDVFWDCASELRVVALAIPSDCWGAW